MKKLLILISVLGFIYVHAFAQNTDSTQKAENSYNSRFNKYITQNDTIFARSVLSDWSEESPNDPELYVAIFNYNLLTAIDKTAEISKIKPADPDCSVITLRDTVGRITGYIVTKPVYKQMQSDAALDAICKGIENYPDRLDMRYCKIFLLGKLKRWNDFTSEIITTLNYAKSHNHRWMWTGGKLLDNAKDALLQSVEEYQQQLFVGDVNGNNMRTIAEAMLKENPKSIEDLNYMAVSYIKETEFSKALQYLKKADKLRKDDTAVLKNMAYVYKQTGDEKRRNECLEKLKKIEEDAAHLN